MTFFLVCRTLARGAASCCGMALPMAALISTMLIATSAAYGSDNILSLRDALTQALISSPRIDAARATIDAAKGAQRTARSFPNPQFSIAAENVAGSRDYAGFGRTEHTYGVTQLVELGGKRTARQDAASAERRAAETGATATRLDIVRETTVAYMEVIAAEDRLTLALEQKNAALTLQAQVARRVSAARDPLFQRNRAEVAVSTAHVSYERSRGSLETAKSKLAKLLGLSVIGQPLSHADFDGAQAPKPQEFYFSKLDTTPDSRGWRDIRDARAADLRLAKAGAIPDIQATLGLRKFAENGGSALIANLSLPLPIFNQNQGEIARADAALRKTEADRRLFDRERRQQIIAVWAEWQTAWTEVQTIRNRTMPEATRAYELALAGFRQGGFTYLDVLDTQRSLFETRTSLTDALLRLHTAQADVLRFTDDAIVDTERSIP